MIMYFPNEQDYFTIDAMEAEGGSFVQALAYCFRTADAHNFHKLLIAFPEYWAEYSRKAERKNYAE